tara:strand:+ start:20839 stop:21843 length:1005 start_codon:yes stop_codon:yes gene_type:complete
MAFYQKKLVINGLLDQLGSRSHTLAFEALFHLDYHIQSDRFTKQQLETDLFNMTRNDEYLVYAILRFKIILFYPNSFSAAVPSCLPALLRNIARILGNLHVYVIYLNSLMYAACQLSLPDIVNTLDPKRCTANLDLKDWPDNFSHALKTAATFYGFLLKEKKSVGTLIENFTDVEAALNMGKIEQKLLPPIYLQLLFDVFNIYVNKLSHLRQAPSDEFSELLDYIANKYRHPGIHFLYYRIGAGLVTQFDPAAIRPNLGKLLLAAEKGHNQAIDVLAKYHPTPGDKQYYQGVLTFIANDLTELDLEDRTAFRIVARHDPTAVLNKPDDNECVIL